MRVNLKKSYISFNGVVDEQVRLILQLYPYQQIDFQVGFKYLAFYIHPNDYGINDWKYLIVKVERRINLWCNRN
jgi:hypothetical protein